MRKLRYILLIFLCAVGMAACQDDMVENVSTNGININKPIQVELKFGIPKSMRVEVSRADNSKSIISTLRLYIFNGDNFISAQDATNISGGTTDNSGRHYTASATLYVGQQTVYAVANTATSIYWENPVAILDEAAEEGKEAFLNALYSLLNTFVTSGTLPTLNGNIIPLSGEGDIEVSENSTATGLITLKRPMAQVKFEMAMHYEVPSNDEDRERRGHKVTFTPESFRIYKVAGSSHVFGSEEPRDVITSNFYNIPTPPVPIDVSDGETAKISGFYLPENIQKGTNCSKYDDREDFDLEKGNTDENKVWTNAPENATYVVIKGDYVEVDEDGQLFRSGQVSYTVHLGDWSTGDYNDFSVLRNYIYTYKMSVRGVNKIVVEAQAEEDSDDFQNSAEGDIIELDEGSEVFNLDAHYEQVYVQYNLSSIASQIRSSSNQDKENLIATSFMLYINSPMNKTSVVEDLLRPYAGTDETGEEAMADIDYRWAKFYSQTKNGLTSYTDTKDNDEYMLNPWEACRKLGQAVAQLVENENSAPQVDNLQISSSNGRYYARFTIYVDDYFYTKDLDGNDVNWGSFTRIDPRTLLIASNWTDSPDGNSTYATARTYISQASIITFYNPQSAGTTNALGIESYNEYGMITGFGNADMDSKYNDDNDRNGRANMLINTEDSRSVEDGRYQLADIDFEKIGYTSANVTSGNIWPLLEWGDKRNSAYKACLSRNRDLNRNGQIDDDEIHWYLPARSQYLRMGIATNSLSSVALFSGDKQTITNYPFGTDGSLIEKGSLYYSNSHAIETDDSWELYWAIEVGAYGSNHKPDDAPTNNQYGYRAQIRCVRNLPSGKVINDHHNDTDDAYYYNDEALADPVHGGLKRLASSEENYVFDFGDRLDDIIFRQDLQDEPYPEHNETSTANMLPAAFVVAKDVIRDEENNEPKRFTVEQAYTYENNPCASYSEDNDNGICWRVPNLNELTVMSTLAAEIGLDDHTSVLSSTKFSNTGVRLAFNFNGNIITAWGAGSENTTGYIRCVRDATEEERSNLVPVN